MKIQSILAAGLLMMFGACTDLSENLYDKINANEYGQTDSEIASIMGRAYASLRGGSFDGANGYAFSELSILFRRLARMRRYFRLGMEVPIGMMAEDMFS